MKHKFTRNLYSFCCVFLLTTGISASANALDLASASPHLPPINNTLTSEWQEYLFKDGVLIEYRMETMDSEEYGREVHMLVFRFTNTTEQKKSCSWMVKIERDGQCYNCSSLNNQDGGYRLKLDANEVAQGDATNLISRSELNIFGNFVNLVPGMTDQKLTGFELVNLTIK